MATSRQELIKMNKKMMDTFLDHLIDVIKKDCKNYFIEKMQEAVQKVVYDEYAPTQYERRGEDGGLKDPSNYLLEAFFDRNGRVCIFMKNMTHGVGKAYYIDEGIVTGENFYDWQRSKAYYYANNGGFARDFYTYMEYEVVKDKKLERLIEQGMRKKGWKIKH